MVITFLLSFLPHQDAKRNTMALKKCKECGKDVSSDAKSCPYCGKKHPTGAWTLPAKIIFILFILFVIGSVAAKLKAPNIPKKTSVQREVQQTKQQTESKPMSDEYKKQLEQHERESAELIALSNNIKSDKSETNQNKQKSIEYMLATLNAGSHISEDHITVARFRSLLQQLSETYIENPQQIADMSVKAQEMLKNDGIDEKLINIMEGMNQLFSRKIENQKYTEYISAYVTLRHKGNTHAQATTALQEMLRNIKGQ